MKPVAFEYAAPTHLDDALQLVARRTAVILAGGQSLVPAMNFRLARPEVVVDINNLGELTSVHVEDGWLQIGAIVRHEDIRTHPIIRVACPVLAEAAGFVGHLAIRNRGTIGGSVAHAEPAAEYGAVLQALGGEVILRSLGGTRTVRADDFFVGPLLTSRAHGELVIGVRVRVGEAGTGQSFLKIARRHGDFALVGVACAIRMTPEGRCVSAGIGLCGAGPKPVRSAGAAAQLEGHDITGDRIRAAAAAAREESEPETDIHASADYRRAVVAHVVAEAIHVAWEKARRSLRE